MRHPRRGRNIAWVIAGLGVVAVLVAVWLTQTRAPGNLQVLLGVGGAKAAIVAGVVGLVYHVRVARRYDRLRRGEGVLLRWRIDPARWRVFREEATARAIAPGLPNELPLLEEIPADGIDLTITDNAFCLGPEFEVLEKNSVVRLKGPVLEIEQRVPSGRYSTRLVVFRLPAQANAEAEVASLAERFASRAAGSQQLVRKVALVALVIVVAGLVALLIWVMSVTHRG